MPKVGDPFNPTGVFSSVWIPPAVFHDPDLTSTAKLCYGRIAHFCGEKNYCWPSQDALAEDMGKISTRTVRECLSQLEAKGFISITQLGLNKTNIYTLLWTSEMEGSLRPSDRKKTSGQDGIESVNMQGISTPERKPASGPLKDEVNPYEVIQPTLSPSPCGFSDPPEPTAEELASVLSHTRQRVKGGRRIKGAELEKLKEWLPSYLSEHRAEEISAAFRMFLDDPYWLQKKSPVYGFISQFSRYAPQNNNGRGKALAPEAAAPEVVAQHPPIQPAGSERVDGLPELARKWNEAVPSGPKVEGWSRRDKRIEERMGDPDFLAVADEVFRRCQAIHAVRPADWLNFRWLFQINKSTDCENWYSVSTGKYTWMEHLDEKTSGVSESEAAIAAYMKSLGSTEEQNATD